MPDTYSPETFDQTTNPYLTATTGGDYGSARAMVAAFEFEIDNDHLDGADIPDAVYHESAPRLMPFWPISRGELLWAWYLQDDNLEGWGTSPETEGEVANAARPWSMFRKLFDDEAPFDVTPRCDPRGWWAKRAGVLSDQLYSAYIHIAEMTAVNRLEDIGEMRSDRPYDPDRAGELRDHYATLRQQRRAAGEHLLTILTHDSESIAYHQSIAEREGADAARENARNHGVTEIAIAEAGIILHERAAANSDPDRDSDRHRDSDRIEAGS